MSDPIGLEDGARTRPVRLWNWGMGRQSTFNPELADEICLRIANGEPLRQICRDDHMPAWTTVYNWIKADASFAERIARARDIGHDAIAENAMEIADEPPPSGPDGRTDAGYVSWQKNRVWTRLQLLSKWSPRYRDKIDQNINGNMSMVVMTGVPDANDGSDLV